MARTLAPERVGDRRQLRRQVHNQLHRRGRHHRHRALGDQHRADHVGSEEGEHVGDVGLDNRINRVVWARYPGVVDQQVDGRRGLGSARVRRRMEMRNSNCVWKRGREAWERMLNAAKQFKFSCVKQQLRE